jgi:hypothetical protein
VDNSVEGRIRQKVMWSDWRKTGTGPHGHDAEGASPRLRLRSARKPIRSPTLSLPPNRARNVCHLLAQTSFADCGARAFSVAKVG